MKGPVVQRSYRFSIIPEWVLVHPDLDGTAVRVFGILDRYAGASGEAWPGLQTVAERIGCSEQTVRRAIRKLEEVGAVRVEEQFISGRQTTNRYHLAGESPMTMRPITVDTPGAVADDRDEGANGDTPRRRARGTESQKDESHPLAIVVADAPPPRARTPKQRARDARIEALALVTRADPTRPPTWYNRASKVLRELAEPEPGDIIIRAALYRRRWPNMTLTMEALAKHWAELTPENALSESEQWALDDPKLTPEQRNQAIATVLGPKVMNALRHVAELNRSEAS